MLEHKLGKELAKTIVGAGIVTLLSACGDSGTCMEPEYGIRSAAELKGASNTYVLGAAENAGQYVTASCRNGCSYDSEVGCCWCPD